METTKKLVRDGKVAVLYSPGYGAGWFTWNSGHPACLFDPEIVELVEQGKHEQIEKLAEKKWGDGFYPGGARQLRVEWLPVGTSFQINEYDGSESVETRDGVDWHIA